MFKDIKSLTFEELEVLQLTELLDDYKKGNITYEDLIFLKKYLNEFKPEKKKNINSKAFSEEKVKNILFCELCKTYFRKKEMSYEGWKILTEYLFTEKETILPQSIDLPKENPFITKLIHANEKNFTTNIGIKLRKYIYATTKDKLKKASDGKFKLESYQWKDGNIIVSPEKDISYLGLDKNKPYIFVSAHSFCEDLNTVMGILDRNAYVTMGSTDQIRFNKESYVLWGVGMACVDRLDEESKNNLPLKQGRILDSGTSVLVYIEGAYNNTENKILEEFYSGPILLSQEKHYPIVPITPFREYGSDEIYVTLGKPMDFTGMSKNEARDILRDKMASMMFEIWLQHASHIKRCELSPNAREWFMEERKSEYLKKPWYRDVWEEELKVYSNPLKPKPKEVRESFDNVQVTSLNASIMGPILARRLEDKKYDFKEYMHQTWNK